VKNWIVRLLAVSFVSVAIAGCGGPESASSMPEKPDPMPTGGPTTAAPGKKPAAGEPPAGVAKPPVAPAPPAASL